MNLYFRFIILVIKNLISPRKVDVFEECELPLKVFPNDLDLNMHMNNGRYLTIMDLGRTDFTMKLDLHKLMVKEKWGAVATAINVVYLKPLSLFDSYTLKTKLIAWDDMWFYLEQKFVKDEIVVASAIVRATFLKGGKRLAPSKVLKASAAKEVEPPEFPKYLKYLVLGEEEFLNYIKSHNKRSKK